MSLAIQRPFISHPAEVPGLLEALHNRGVVFLLDPPDLTIRFPEGVREPSLLEARQLDELRPYIYVYLLSCATAEGRFFCSECLIECTRFDSAPDVGDVVTCVNCVRGELSCARAFEAMNRSTGTPFWRGDN